jgi:putative intracellular protease/amidase
MRVAALLFDKLTVLDIVGPTEVVSWIPDVEIVWVGKEKGPVKAVPTGLTVMVDHTLNEVSSADILMIPGGPGVRGLIEDEVHLDWIRQIHDTTTWTTSICTGSLLLGAAGLLNGLTATTHWNAAQMLATFGATYSEDRVVSQGKIVTSWLMGQIVGDEAAKAAQLCIEYDPQPPYDSGAPSKASADVVAQARETVQEIVSKSLSI